jgi:outer membrane immunogenic protein
MFAVAAIGLAALATGGRSVAADLQNSTVIHFKSTAPGEFPYNWSGVYVGAVAAGASGGSVFDFVPSDTSTGRFGVAGGVLGVTLGYNAQFDPWVLGLETDLNSARITGATNCPGAITRCETRSSWFGTTRGRVGYALGRVMPYVTAGLAYGNLQANVTTLGSAAVTRVGWTAGAGVEFSLTGNLTAKIEYLFLDMGQFDCGFACGAPPVNVRFDTHLLRGGINYRF